MNVRFMIPSTHLPQSVENLIQDASYCTGISYEFTVFALY